MSKKQVIQAMNWSSRPLSIDEINDGVDGGDVPKELPDMNSMAPDEIADRNIVLDYIRANISKLPPRERDVLSLKYGLVDDNPLSLDVIAKKLNISLERVEFFEKRALTKLRRLVSSCPLASAI